MAKTTQSKKTEWFGMKVSPEEKRKIKDLAKRKRMSQSELILTLVDDASEIMDTAPKKMSILELAGDLVGVLQGPPDLSTNKDYMDGYGE